MKSVKSQKKDGQNNTYLQWWGNAKNVPKRTRKDVEKWWKTTGSVLHAKLYSNPPPTWDSVTLTPHQLLYLLNTHRDSIRKLDDLEAVRLAKVEQLQAIFAAFDHWCANSDEHTSNRA